VAGAALIVVFALFMTLVQANVDDRMRGRVVSVYSLAFRGAIPLGNLLAGSLASAFSAPAVLVANGIALTCVGGFLLARNRGGVREL